jgi:hypothetical protein
VNHRYNDSYLYPVYVFAPVPAPSSLPLLKTHPMYALLKITLPSGTAEARKIIHRIPTIELWPAVGL